MSDENDGAATGPEGAGIDPFAAAMALSGASSAKADAFLEKQSRLVDLQCEYLADKDKFELSHLRWRRFTEQMRGALQVATLVVGLAAATGAGLIVWDAAHSAGLIVESFAVPPDMAARGLSGDVVASQMLDKLTAMQEATNSSRGPQSYANNWGSNLKVEIPDTGVSIGELQHFLKEWLGHDTRIRGEVYRTPSGIAVTARAGAEFGATFEGKDGELDALLQKAAEHVYAQTQPYRYANFMDRNRDAAGLADRQARARAIYWDLTHALDREEQAWAWNGLGTLASATEGPARGNVISAAYYRKALQVWPDFTIGHFALGFREFYMEHQENELAEFRAASRLLHRDQVPDVNPRILVTNRGNTDAIVAYLTGDWANSGRQARIAAEQHLIMANQS